MVIQFVEFQTEFVDNQKVMLFDESISSKLEERSIIFNVREVGGSNPPGFLLEFFDLGLIFQFVRRVHKTIIPITNQSKFIKF